MTKHNPSEIMYEAEEERLPEPEFKADPQDTALAPWEPQPGQMAAVVSTLTDPKKIIASMNDTLPMTDLKERPDKFTDVIIHKATVMGEGENEPTDVRRTVLISDKGVNYACVSEGVISSLEQITALIGPPPWDPPLKLKLIEKQTRRGYRTYRLIPV